MKNKFLKYLTLFLAIFVLNSCIKPRETEYSTSSEKAFLVITNATTQFELTKIAAEFKTERNIDVDFSKTKFSSDGTIKKLDFEVNCNDGFRGDATSTAEILQTKNSGFSRNYRKNGKDAFVMGAM